MLFSSLLSMAMVLICERGYGSSPPAAILKKSWGGKGIVPLFPVPNVNVYHGLLLCYAGISSSASCASSITGCPIAIRSSRFAFQFLVSLRGGVCVTKSLIALKNPHAVP